MTDGLIVPDWPAPDNVVAATTTRRAADAVPEGTRYLQQVHGATVVPVEALGEAGSPPAADAVVGFAAGDICAVRTADCLPVLFCSADGTRIGAAHAGWRGVLAGVLENTVAAMRCPATDLLAWLGPAISQANFEVGDEVRASFVGADPDAGALFAPGRQGRWQADLYGLARQRLQGCGVEAVYGGGWCTVADDQRFYSYRRSADTGRMVSFVALK